MKKIFESIFPAVLSAVFLGLLLSAQGIVGKKVAELRISTAQHRAVAQRSKERSVSIVGLMGKIAEENSRLAELPIVAGKSADELRIAIEHCAMQSGISSSVSVSQAPDGEAELKVAFHSGTRGTDSFLRRVMARREFFTVKSFDMRRLDEDLYSVDVVLRTFMSVAADEE